MINLIPPSALEQVKREYWIRVATVFLILISLALLIVAILNIPVFVLVRSQLDAFQTEYAQANLESESFQSSEDAVKQANDIATLLSRTQKDTFTAIIAEIEGLAGDEIGITEITLSRNGTKLNPISVHGTAASRLAATTFQSALEEHPLFQNAVLPLSNLARDKDIAFTITIDPQVTE